VTGHATAAAPNTVLDVQGLSIRAGDTELVSSVSFTVAEGEIVGIVGESGSGKTLTSLAVSRLLPRGLASTADVLRFRDLDLRADVRRADLRRLGSEMGLVFQDPMSSLNPAMRIGTQMSEVLRVHAGLSRRDALQRAAQALEDVHINDPERRLRQYPHELSGGMRQRVMIAMGMLTEVHLLVADEPTTALDVTVQAQVMSLMKALNERVGTAVLLISHNIALLSEICDRILVMYRGRLVESVATGSLQQSATHPYTQLLIGAIPDLRTDRSQELLTIGNFNVEELDDA
jgi:ABC-type dipeptide/oligopeptide/nickel transport system ATPase component